MLYLSSAESMQTQVSSHASTVADAYVTVEQLKDVDSRSLSRTAAATAACEERAAKAAAAVVRGASEQAQARFESLQGRLHAELASVQAQVRSLSILVIGVHLGLSATIFPRCLRVL